MSTLTEPARFPAPHGSSRDLDTYLDELPDDRRVLLSAVVECIRADIPADYAETLSFGMPTWEVPLERYPSTYNNKPLARSFQERWTAGGRTLDMGKSCLRFTSVADLDPHVLGETIAATSVDGYIARYEAKPRSLTSSSRLPATRTSRVALTIPQRGEHHGRQA